MVSNFKFLMVGCGVAANFGNRNHDISFHNSWLVCVLQRDVTPHFPMKRTIMYGETNSEESLRKIVIAILRLLAIDRYQRKLSRYGRLRGLFWTELYVPKESK